MTKERLYLLVIGVLLMSNLLLAVVIWRGSVTHRPEPKLIIKERLQLDAVQMQAYEQLIQVHRQAVRNQESRIIPARARLYQTLSSDHKTTLRDSMIHELGLMQEQTEQIHLAHFQAIQQLLRPDQRPRFNAFIEELPMLFGPPPMKR